MTPSSHSNDDAALWSEWGQLHERAVRGYLLGMVRRYDLAEDLTQEVFCKAWQARERYQEKGAARAYLLRIADRLALDHLRKSGRELNLGDEGWKQIEPTQRDAAPDEVMDREELFDQLSATLDSLSTPQRRVLLLRYFGEFSFAEIATMMGSPVGTTLSHCHRGLLALRKLLTGKDK